MSTVPQLSARDVSLLAMAFQSLKDDSALQIDYTKLADLAGYKTAASASACFSVVKKKLLGGASVSNAAGVGTPAKKSKAKAPATNGDTAEEDDDEAAATKAAPKKRAKAIKAEPVVDAEGGGDADTEVTPTAESPKKAAPKRKRGPNKPKDPNAPPAAKRGKKGAAGNKDDNDAANAQLYANENGSIFGGDAVVKGEDEEDQEEEGDERVFDAEEQKMADDALFGVWTTPEEEPAA